MKQMLYSLYGTGGVLGYYISAYRLIGFLDNDK
jgi:hypothetical protein